MALKQDQRAMLQLLLERGQSYEDIASLLGVEIDDARARAQAALSELGGRDPDADVALTDYLLGQADPIGRADVARHLQQDEQALELATELATKLTAIAPEAELPTLPQRRGKQRPVPTTQPESPPAFERASIRSPSLSRRQAQLGALIVGAVAVVVAVVLVVSGVFEGDDGAAIAGDASTIGGEAAAAGGAGEGEILSTVELEPQGGGSGSGLATFGLAAPDQAYLDLMIEGLRPAPNGRSYVLWLLVGGQRGHPLTPLEIPESGELDERFPIDGSQVVIAAATRQVDVSLAEDDELAQVIQRAANQGDAVIPFTGQSVLRGRVPLADRLTPGNGGDGPGGGSGGNGSGGGQGGSGNGSGGDGSGGGQGGSGSGQGGGGSGGG